MKNIVILGSTGSLGTQTLEIIKKHPDKFRVFGLCANKNERLLARQAKQFNVPTTNTIVAIKEGQKPILELVKGKKVDAIVNVMAGLAGLRPTITALKSGKTLIQGNKEAIIGAGAEIKPYLDQIIPLDSEHNAIFEILKAAPAPHKIKNIILPCSGGPFLNKSVAELKNITIKEVTSHPRWKMGPKVSVESALLLNKGFEIIEAHYLFNLPLSKIKVALHPQCKIHGAVEFEGGEIISYQSKPDMREHIKNCLFRLAEIPFKAPIKKNKSLPLQLKIFSPFSEFGTKIVLQNFKKSPQQFKEFIRKEEKIILKFLSAEISFPELKNKLLKTL